MPQSLVMNYMHLVFSTKYRQPFIVPEIENRLFHYLGGICNKLLCHPLKVGGYLDHVHILCNLAKTIALCDLVKEVKVHSSLWMKKQGPDFNNFYWQDGYGGFSVGRTELTKTQQYVENQAQHHKSMGYKEEYRIILDAYGMPRDEQHMWD